MYTSMTDSTITLHPQARDLLFKYFRVIARIFRDVLGQLEIDYRGSLQEGTKFPAAPLQPFAILGYRLQSVFN